MKGERGYIVKVRFLRFSPESGFPSIGKKDYHYLIGEELMLQILKEAYSRGESTVVSEVPIKIVNNKGYNYRDAECIIIQRYLVEDITWQSIDLEKSPTYREIIGWKPGKYDWYGDLFHIEAKRLSDNGFVNGPQILKNLIDEGAMPKEIPTNNKMKINGVEVSASTLTSINAATTDKWQKAATAGEVLLNGDKVSNSGDIHIQVNSIPGFSMCDKIGSNIDGWPDYAYKPFSILNGTTNWGNFGTSTITNGTSITTNTTSPIGIGLDTSKFAGNNEKKEGKNMFENIMKDIKFGPATDVRFSIYGPAFNGGDRWLARHEGEWVDVSDMLIDVGNICYVMPIAKNSIKEGDFILHKGKWARVDCIVEEENFISVEKINEQEVVQVLPTKNMFGFDYYTKLMCPIENFEGAEGFGATTDNPFGMLPFIMAMKDGKKDNLLPFMMMSGKIDMSNPMMLMMLSGDNSNLGLMMAMMAMKKKDK